jgi:hypothetical protein
MNNLKRKFDGAVRCFPYLTKPDILTMIETKLRRACDKYTLEEEEAWVRVNGPLPEIIGFDERTRRITFAPNATVHTIPACGDPCYIIPVPKKSEPTKEFDGQRFRMFY